MDLPACAAYGDPAYWDARFREEDAYEWCGDWASLREAVLAALGGARRVLILGAGSSSLPFDLAAADLPHLAEVVASDISPTAVSKIAEKARALPGGTTVKVSAVVADMLALPFPAASFDAVLEKGTFDCLEVAGSDGKAPERWNPPPDVRARMHGAVSEAHRVLKPDGGRLISITWATPLFRRGHYYDDARYDWGGPDEVVAAVGGSVPVILYCLTRGRRAEGAAWARGPPGEVTRTDGGEGLPSAPAHEHMDREDYLLGIGGGSSSGDDGSSSGDEA